MLNGRYRLDEQLASGGMAQVWRGTDEVLRRSIAVKILHPHLAADETFVARFRQEAIAVAKLSHPAIVSVYDTCSDNGVQAIVMELVQGQTLRQRLDAGALDPWTAANIAAQVAGALDVAHAAGLVHRDIKPANILLSEDGRVKVGDFGIAKAAEESADLTQEGSFIGTAKYLAPEQVEGAAVDGRTDLYSLGVVLYEMLCGRVPFEGDTSSATALARLHQEPRRPRLIRASIPPELEAVTMTLLEREPDRRYPTATHARAALVEAGATDAPSAVDTGATSVVPVGAPHGGMPPTGAGRPVPGAPGVGPGVGVAGRPGLGHLPSGGYRHEYTTQVRYRDNERNWVVPVLLAILAAISIVIAAVLISRSGSLLGDDDGASGEEETPAEPRPLQIVGAKDFDPLGDWDEYDHVAQLVYDADPESYWQTEHYGKPESPWQGKPGVGLFVILGDPGDLRQVELTTRSEGWTMDVYVTDDPPTDPRAEFNGDGEAALGAWGTPVAHVENQPSGTVTVDLPEGTKGNAVLLWFTVVGNQELTSGEWAGYHIMEIGNIRVLG
ncbi:MAG TPA: protein kinase [Acidimicrobiales bacterium]